MPKVWLIALISLAAVASDEAGPGKSVDLIIMAGQSNMQGYMGNAAFYPQGSVQEDARIPFFYLVPGDGDRRPMPAGMDSVGPPEPHWSMTLSKIRGWLGTQVRSVRSLVAWPPKPSPSGKWTWLGPQWGRFPDGHFGPEISFARLLLRDGQSPAVFKFSKSSTSLAIDWKRPGESGLYDHFVSTLRAAIADLRNRGYQVNVRGVIWIQGENDVLQPWTAQQYAERLGELLGHMRRNFLHGDVPVLLGADEAYPMMAQRPEVRLAQERFADADACVGRTSMEGLSKADFTHLAPAGLVEQGSRLYRDYLAARAACSGNVLGPGAVPR